MGREQIGMDREQVRMGWDWMEMGENQGGKSKENGLVIRFVGYLGKMDYLTG